MGQPPSSAVVATPPSCSRLRRRSYPEARGAMGLVVGWPRRRMGQQMVGEVASGLSLFGGASSEVRRCNL
eukprot:scaffold85620_cov36-Phaeocystis_antarctica.AAC.1